MAIAFSAPVSAQSVVINELMASNNSLTDPDFGETGDWVELYNLSGVTVDLSGYSLSDDASNLHKFPIPSGFSLVSGGYLVVWLDDHAMAGTRPHANFKLSAGGESLYLTPTGSGVSEDDVTFGEQTTDQSYARIPNGSGDFQETTQPTLEAANVLAQSGPAPVFSQTSGRFSTSLSVTITAPGATSITYTTNGDDPTAGSQAYSIPVSITNSKPLKARAYYADKDPSAITTASYFINPTTTLSIIDIAIPEASLHDPLTGIYTNYNESGPEWERLAHIAVISEDGSSVEEFQAGVRIHGGTTRHLAKKSLRLYLRPEYGRSSVTLSQLKRNKNAPIEELVLRAGGNETFLNSSTSQRGETTYIRDQIQRDWVNDLGHRSSDGFFAALYINGSYWGLYNPCERLSEPYFSETYGGDQWDIIRPHWQNSPRDILTEASEGDLTAWNEFRAWIDANTGSFSNPALYAELKTRIDLPNFVDYFTVNIFSQNQDWPQNNWVATRSRDDPLAKWRWFEWDAEWGLELYQYTGGGTNPADSISWAADPYLWERDAQEGGIAPLSRVLMAILANDEGEQYFLSRMEEALNFEFREASTQAQFGAYVSIVDPEIAAEANRWAPYSSLSESQLIAIFDPAVGRVNNFLTTRPDEIRGYYVSFFGLAGVETLNISATGAGSGQIGVNGRLVNLPWTGKFFAGSEVRLDALPDDGSRVVQWAEGATPVSYGASYEFTAGTNSSRNINVVFSAGATATPVFNDVIINELWINDNGTTYTTTDDRPITGDWVELLVTDPAGADLRGMRLTNNPTKTTNGVYDDGDGSLIIPDNPVFSAIPQGTCILLLTGENVANKTNYPTDDLDPSDGRMILSVLNGTLDFETDPGFTIGTSNEALVLLAPGATALFEDDYGIDFIAEGADVTPAGFGVDADAPEAGFINPLTGLGDDDGAIFVNHRIERFDNNNGEDANQNDATPGAGGWIVDPPSAFTGDEPGAQNILTPGGLNYGQSIGPTLLEQGFTGTIVK